MFVLICKAINILLQIQYWHVLEYSQKAMLVQIFNSIDCAGCQHCPWHLHDAREIRNMPPSQANRGAASRGAASRGAASRGAASRGAASRGAALATFTSEPFSQ
jgi:hypothetical protein